MPTCAIYGCNNYNSKTKGTGIRYFCFPLTDDMREKWIQICKRENKINIKNARICSCHFSDEDYTIKSRLSEYSSNHARSLKPDAVPNCNLPRSKQYEYFNQSAANQRTFKEVQEYLMDIVETDNPTPPKIARLKEGVINENIVNVLVEPTLHSVIQIEKHELDYDPLASTSSGATTDLFETIAIKQEIETEESATPENGIMPVIKTDNPAKELTTEHDPDMLFCLSLYPSLQRIPEKYRNKAKIDILLVIDKYVTMK